MHIIHGETLLDFITEQNPRNLQRVQVLADIGAAMAFLHSSRPQIVHGDLKDSNIFVEETCHARRRAKLLDFDLSVLRTKHSRSHGGTVHWMLAVDYSVSSIWRLTSFLGSCYEIRADTKIL